MKFLITSFSLCLFVISLSVQAAPEVRVQSVSDSLPSYELGITLGTPAVGNLVLGYWDHGEFPWLARVSGMYYGETRGVQLDFGYEFFRRGRFSQYAAISAITTRLDLDDKIHTLHGIGPTYGLNLYGFSVSAGIVFGDYKRYDKFWGYTDSYSAQLIAQVGYTYLF